MDLGVPDELAVTTVLTGRVFTHRLSARELDHDLLDITPDLAPIVELADDRLADGSPVTEVRTPYDAALLAERGIPADAVDDEGALLLPAGYLRGLGFAADDLAGVRVTPDGLAVERVAAVGGPVAEQLLAALADAEPVEIDAAVWLACAADADLFTEPLPPLRDAIEAAGLAYEGPWLATAGFDFDAWATERELADLMDRHELTEQEALAVLVAVLEYGRLAELIETSPTAEPEFAAAEPGFADADVVSGMLRWLAVPAIAEAVLEETMGTDPEGGAALRRFVEVLEPHAPRPARVALHWLRGKALERLGAVAEAEIVFQEAESLDPDWPPVLIELARYAGDRGDAARGLALLRRAGVPADDPMVEVFTAFDEAARPELGRNEPCWCGSGRKYKQCHLGRERASIADRSAWLYQKALQFTVDGPWQETVLAVAAERSPGTDLDDEAIDPFVLDAVLFEGGAFADFVAARGFLLPADERALADQWLRTGRSVYEVVEARPEGELTVRDVRSGDEHSVPEFTAGRLLAPGELICARIVPVGDDTLSIYGEVELVEPGQRDDLLALLAGEPDPADLVAALTR